MSSYNLQCAPTELGLIREALDGLKAKEAASPSPDRGKVKQAQDLGAKVEQLIGHHATTRGHQDRSPDSTPVGSEGSPLTGDSIRGKAAAGSSEPSQPEPENKADGSANEPDPQTGTNPSGDPDSPAANEGTEQASESAQDPQAQTGVTEPATQPAGN